MGRKFYVRIRDGVKELATEHGWARWDSQRMQWRSSAGYQNFPLPDNIAWERVKPISTEDIIVTAEGEEEKGFDGGIEVEEIV